MKKIMYFLIVLLAFVTAFTFVGCEDGDSTDNEPLITVNRTFVKMTLGDTYTLKATVTPYEYSDLEVRWTVGDESVVSCDEGRLRALSIGKTTVTATIPGGKYFSCDVEVKDSLDNMYVVEGESIEISTDRFENYFDNPVYFSTDTSVVSVSNDGDKVSFDARSPGKSSLYITDGDSYLAVRTVVVLPSDTYGVNFDIPEMPRTVSYNRDGIYTTTVELTSFEIERSVEYNVLDTGEVIITLKVRYRKTSDSGGEGANNAIRFDINIYSEETEGLLKNLRIFENDRGADEYEYVFKFSAVLGTGDGERNFYFDIPTQVG